MARFFEPYVGAQYEAGLLNGHRLLLIGESHYNEPGHEPCGREATREIVELHRNGNTISFLDYIEDSSCGHRLTNSRDEFWQRVAFANFVQRPMDSPVQRPNPDDWEAGISPFWETVAELAPDLVFMFTSAWSNWLPNVAPDGIAARTGPVGEGATWLWRYAFAHHDVLIARFNHSSARHNPSISVWKAWADHCWRTLESNND